MSTADGPKLVRRPLFTGSNHPVDIVVYTDANFTTRMDITGKTVKVLINDNGTTRTYLVSSHDDPTQGETHITLIGTNHQNAGDWTVQVLLDDVPKQDYTVTFRTLLA
jgi:hypothetical protein